MVLEDAPLQPTYWAASTKATLAQASDDLRGREGTIDSCIESVERDDATSQPDETATEARERVGAWLREGTELTGATWTGLRSNFREKTQCPFSSNAALEYLRGLIDTKRAHRISAGSHGR
ncbi:MAG: hypothetical protein DCC49_02170 [Acidobacteria bacterium]|nr:MAG: hypothetical protein DCC49_02170 [Acidobacteriota bacterium]